MTKEHKMTLDIVRRIRGNLHGSIDISLLEDKVIAHPIFQRLRRIRQTAFLSFVFPGASHSRFEHSLGVMFLANKAWTKIRENQKRLERGCRQIPNFSQKECELSDSSHGLLYPTFKGLDALFSDTYILQTLRLAALLHDLGHPPFSHSGERFLPSLSNFLQSEEKRPEYIQEYLQGLNALESREKKGLNPPVRHEIFSILLIDRILTEIYSQDANIQYKVNPQDVASVIAPQIPPTSHSPLSTLNAHQVCHELVSGEIDIDRMDYLQRDSRECGVIYGNFDVDRILDSLTLYHDQKEKCLHLAIRFSGLAAFEDYLRARQSMYIQLYFHKTSVACEAMLEALRERIESWSLPVDLQAYANIDEWNMREQLIGAARSTLSEQSFQEFSNILDDLYYRRKIWKRVYETTSLHSHDEDFEEIEDVENILKCKGIPYQKVSSINYITKFQPRKKSEDSKNYLRLIKKDGKQFPRVLPLEDFSSLISSKKAVHIHRIYVDLDHAEEANGILMSSFYEND